MRYLLQFLGDCTIASLTNSDVHLVYCKVDMHMKSEEEPITLVVQYLVCSEAYGKLAIFPSASLKTTSWTTKVLCRNQGH